MKKTPDRTTNPNRHPKRTNHYRRRAPRAASTRGEHQAPNPKVESKPLHSQTTPSFAHIPMDVLSLWKAGWSLYSANPGTVLWYGFLMFVVGGVLTGIVQAITGGADSLWPLVLLVTLAVQAYVELVKVRLLFAYSTTTTVSTDSFVPGQSLYWKFLAQYVIKALLIAVGFLLFLIPGIILMLRWYVSAFVTITSDIKEPGQILARSKALTRGNMLFLLWFEIASALLIMASALFFVFPLLLTVPTVGLARTILSLKLLGESSRTSQAK